MNAGLLWVLVPCGLYLATKRARWLIAFAVLPFLVGNLFALSSEISANHKFFNFAIIFADVFAAAFLVWLMGFRNLFTRSIVITLMVILVLSGCLDIPLIFNERFISDSPPESRTEIEWIER